jgi:hypothetical protein
MTSGIINETMDRRDLLGFWYGVFALFQERPV